MYSATVSAVFPSISFPVCRVIWGREGMPRDETVFSIRYGCAALPPPAMAPIHSIRAQGFTASWYCPTPAQPSWPSVMPSQSKEPLAVGRPSTEQESVSPAFSVYFFRVSAPNSAAIWAKAALQELAKASFRVCSPWMPEQVTVSPPISTLPVQFHVRLSASVRVSSAAVRVTVLNTDPGTKVADRKRFR